MVASVPLKMRLTERQLQLPLTPHGTSLLTFLANNITNALANDQLPVRLAVTRSSENGYDCEVGVYEGWAGLRSLLRSSIFDFRRREAETTSSFNTVLVIPTGIGAQIGGHAGDAAPIAKLLGASCDSLITHPNVVNASDMNELPSNGMYVEGSLLSRMLMGNVGLQNVRSNRVLVVLDNHEQRFVDAAINTVNAARATYGLESAEIVVLEPPLRTLGETMASGRASGTVENLEALWEILDEREGEFDAIALASVVNVEVPHIDYFRSGGEVVNPWGGVEAMLTHTISSLYDVPTAHAPMMESAEIANIDPGVVDPRIAAEVISLTFLQCVLKGLHTAPRIVTDKGDFGKDDIFTVENVSCLVIPDGCIGLPTLAALNQGIPVVAVRENRNLMRNDLTRLPWEPGQLYIVENYWEAAGLLTSLREGISPGSTRRPLSGVKVSRTVSERSIKTN